MKVPTSTSFDRRDFKRIQELARAEHSSEAHIIRKLALAGLRDLEREVLGAEFVGGVQRREVKEISA